MKHKVKRIHFVGIGGVGMSGIAEVLLNLGFYISGSDVAVNLTTRSLEQHGATVYHGHCERHIAHTDVVVISSAIPNHNPEVVAARAQCIPVVPRAMMLAELMRLKQGIAIAGTHGKTTTTSLTASILESASLDPTFVIGGRLHAARVNARLGKGDFLVAEADESDASFLYLTPVIAAITNIDHDHMPAYGYDFEKIKGTFIDFLHRLPFYGRAMLCIDDPHVRAILPNVTSPITTYGVSNDAMLRAENICCDGVKMRFDAVWQNGVLQRLPIFLNLPGHHNVLNALAAIAIALEVGVDNTVIQTALAEFQGVGRRFQCLGEQAFMTPGGCRGGHYILVDDYGHHPAEVKVTLDAARQAYPGRRIVLAFQPHRYTRTRDCFDDFVKVLSRVDTLLLSEVYPAGEAPIMAANGRALAEAIQGSGKIEPIFIEHLHELPQAILDTVQNGDVVITMGAGSIGNIAQQLLGGDASC